MRKAGHTIVALDAAALQLNLNEVYDDGVHVRVAVARVRAILVALDFERRNLLNPWKQARVHDGQIRAQEPPRVLPDLV